MAPIVLGQSRDIAAALNPRLDAENSGMASIFKPSVSSQSVQKWPPICRNLTQMWRHTTVWSENHRPTFTVRQSGDRDL